METFTAGELRNKLKGVPNDAHVYILTDFSADNWDEEHGRWRKVNPIESVERERIHSETAFGFESEFNVIISIEQ